jgi:hypothetical protein
MSKVVVKSSRSSIGFFGLLTIVFVTLKLTNYIDWSWWWILSPLWIPVSLVIFVALITAIVLEYKGLLK